MILSRSERIALMARLGEYLLSDDPSWLEVKREATRKNPWFIPAFVDRAVHEIAEAYLSPHKLEQWLAAYPETGKPAAVKDVGLVLAGNIPAVGFHDFLCGFMSGHHLSLKVSSRDAVLIPHWIDMLTQWSSGLESQIHIREMLKGCDAYIATGSNNSARYFAYYFGKYPHIIRRNRTSVAVLDGTETPEELQGLADDVLLYFGLGCRNVTKLYVPEGYDFSALEQAFSRYGFLQDVHHYHDNFDYNLSLLLLNQIPYRTDGTVLLVEQKQWFSPISVLYYETYREPEAVWKALEGSEDLQGVVGHRERPFGSAQSPALSDYADRVDTLAFLNTL
jgi:hypothetical protein